MSRRDYDSLYDYDYEDQDEEEPYIYSTGNAYDDDDQRTEYTEDTIPHRLEDTVYKTTETVPFYGDTTNKSVYTWKVPNRNERRTSIATETKDAAAKIPFYSETTHRSQYVPFDASVQRARLSRKTASLPTSNVPIDTQTTYRNLFQELEIGKRQKLIHTCPAEKVMHQTAMLKNSRRENGHYFMKFQPTPLLNVKQSKTTSTQ